MDPDIAREQVIDQAARDVRAGRTADPSIVDWLVRDQGFHAGFVAERRDAYADEHARLTNPDGSTESIGRPPASLREFVERHYPWLGPTTGPRTERLVVSVSTEELEQIEARARADGRTRSDWVRRTLLGDVQPGRAPSRGGA